MAIIDAKNKILGRLASEISKILMGKHKPSYVPYKNKGEAVTIINANQLIITGNKLQNKIYYRHTTYLGHLKAKQMKEFSKVELLQKAVWNMLPKNQLRKTRMKLLKIL